VPTTISTPLRRRPGLLLIGDAAVNGDAAQVRVMAQGANVHEELFGQLPRGATIKARTRPRGPGADGGGSAGRSCRLAGARLGQATTSFPAMSSGIVFSCTGVASMKPRSSTARRRSGWRLKAVNSTIGY